MGPGRVGSSLVAAARGAGHRGVRSPGARTRASAVAEAEVVAALRPRRGDRGAAASRVAAALPPLRFLGHTSGAVGLEALARRPRAGTATFSLHPLQTVPDARAGLHRRRLRDHRLDAAALALARSLAERLGMRPFEIADASRAAYHAAASMASNFLVALEESRRGAARRAPAIEDGRASCSRRSSLRTAANWAERGPEALTGPIARGDEATVARHREAIAERRSRALPLYRALAERTRAIAGGAAMKLVRTTLRASRAAAGPRREGADDRPGPDDGRPARRPPLAARAPRATAATSWS